MKLLPATIGFGDLLRRILVFEKMHPLHEIADALGITVRNFCTRLRNGARFDPDDVAILLRVIDDERLRAWLFADSGLLLVRQPAMTSDGSNLTLVQRTAACAMEAMSAICGLADAVELSMLAGPQIAAIECHLNRAQSGLASIKLHFLPPPPGHSTADKHAVREDFVQLVRRVLLTDQGVRPSDLAAVLGLSGAALHARLAGRVGFLPAELRQLFRRFPDPELADYLLAGTPHTAIPLRRPSTQAWIVARCVPAFGHCARWSHFCRHCCRARAHRGPRCARLSIGTWMRRSDRWQHCAGT